MDLSQYAELFLAESQEHLSAFNKLLLEWERHPESREPVQGIFRAVHTIKGMAATMGYTAVAELAHRAENLLDKLRSGSLKPNDAMLQLLFRTADALDQAVERSVAGRAKEPAQGDLLAELDRAAGGGAAPHPPTPSSPVEADVEMEAMAKGRLVRVVLRADAQLKGGRALIVLQKARALGEVGTVQPGVATLETEDFDGRFSFRLETGADVAAIEAAVKTAGDVESVQVGEAGAAAPMVETAGEAGRARHIRVDLRRLDALMNLIGELVTSRGRLAELAGLRRDQSLEDVALQISRLTADLQNEIVLARMTPAWQVLDRFPRLVRDVARQLGKQVSFRVEGKDIELDRTILDELSDPLVHLLRNAVDHGIEPPADRKRAGKKPEGEIVLSAVRDRASVAITISDDGRGINREATLARAKQQGLVDAGTDRLTDDQLFRIIARPGFTTAERVTELSGRGVGIDVVANRMRVLGGSFDIRTETGRGTTVTLRLPVTLAIIRALLAQVGEECYALPLTHVAETVEFDSGTVTMVGGRETMVLRERAVPLVDLRALLGARGTVTAAARRPVIVLEMGERRTGVVVDRMLGQQEIVVKSFEAPVGTLPVFSGATILGDGTPTLILDAGGLL